ncbi:serine racemase-like isoform X4 [Rhinoraja longicauda]
MLSQYCVSLGSIQKAQSVIGGLVHLTPVLTNSTLDQRAERQIFLKCELFQKTGSFKIRGALNAVSSLVERGREGSERRAVVTHSSGNHGQALALAARLQGVPSYVVVPRTAPACKKAAMAGYGAILIECEPSDQSREEVATRTVAETQGILVHPNQDPLVIAGQGTIGLEILQQVPDVQAVVVPVGGGGLISGIAVAIKARRAEWPPPAPIVYCNPSPTADAASRREDIRGRAGERGRLLPVQAERPTDPQRAAPRDPGGRGEDQRRPQHLAHHPGPGGRCVHRQRAGDSAYTGPVAPVFQRTTVPPFRELTW